MAFLALLLFTSPSDSLEYRFAAKRLCEIREQNPLIWSATMAAMYGVHWTISCDLKAIWLMSLSYQPKDSDTFSDDLVIAFVKTLIGQISINSMLHQIQASLGQWKDSQERIKKIPGSSQLASDLSHLLAGNKSLVSWASKNKTLKNTRITGVSQRTLRGCRRGDDILISASARRLTISELLRRATRLAASATDKKRFYLAKTLSNDAVCITRIC